jgi:hypothetical protein
MHASARSFVLSILVASGPAVLAGCELDLDDVEVGDAIGESAEGLYANLNFLWSGNPVVIPVCWENPSGGSIVRPTFTVSEATSRAWVRDAIEGQWSRYARVNFTQWDTCTSGEAGVHIQILKTGGSSAPGGSTLNGVNNGVKLNLYYNDRQADCQASAANLKRCVQAVALHEFGHVLGFYHEEERPDYPGGTGPCAKQSFPNANPQFYGAYDINSVMSYCGQPASDISTWKMAISPGDIASVQKAYGRRKAGQFAAARGADMMANNNANGPDVFIWDADEALGQLWSYDFAQQAFTVTANGLTSCLDTFPGAAAGNIMTAGTCFFDSFQRFPLNSLFLRGYGGLCLDLPGGNTANGTPLQVWQCGAFGGSNQRWTIDSSRRIRFGSSSKCVTWVPTDGSSMFLWDCGAAPFTASQSFFFTSDGSLRLGSDTARCVDVQANTSADYLAGHGLPGNGARLQTFTCLSSQLNQKWNLSGTFKNQAGLCIDVASASNSNGTPVQTFGCNGTIAQEWDYYWK